MRMIAKDPAGRPSLTEVVAELERFDGLARTQPGRQRIAVLVRKPEVSLWQLDPLSARPPRLLLGPEELGSPVAILPTPDDGWLLLANEGDLAAHGGAFVRRLSADGQTLARYANRGIGPGEVTHAAAMALAPDESVLVIDRDSRRIHRYRSGGGYLAGFGGRGRGRGSFEDPRALAVHHDGKIDVLDAGTNQVQRLHPDGRYDTRWALSGNSREGELLRLTGMHRSAEGRLILAEADTPSLRIIEPNGNLGQTLAFPDANAVRGWVDVVSDPDGAIYVAPRGSTSIARFRGDGELEPVVESPFPIAQLLLLNG
jgi:serine/threonine-protein kinase